MKNTIKKTLCLLFVALISLSSVTVFYSVDASAAITVYSQTDSRWSSHPYGYSNKAGTTPTNIGKGGCGILALVNAVYYMNGNFISPTALADWSVRNGHRVNGVGTAHSLYPAYSKAYGSTYGFSCSSANGTTSWSTLKSHLQSGGTAIVPTTTIATGSAHLLVIADYDSSNSKYLILDSYASSNRGTSSGYAWMTQSQFLGRMTYSKFILISNTSPSSHTVNSGYSKNYTAYLKAPENNHYVFDANHKQTGGYVNASDPCTIIEVYTDGCCKFSYVLDNGSTRTAYGKIDWFTQKKDPAPTGCSCSTAYAGDYVCTTASANLNIRSTHSTSGSVVGSIPKGATVHISKATGTGANDWGHVSYNGASGYVSMQYMSKKGPAHADSPTLNWWLSDSAYGNAVSDFRVGNRYYFCYHLYDSVTGKLWDEVSSDNYSVRIAIYNPDGSLNYDSTYNSDDDGWISIYYQKPGTYTRKITISGDFLFEGSDTFYVAPDPKKINASASTVNLTIGEKEKADIYVWTNGYHDGTTVLAWSPSNDNTGCAWGEWNSENKLALHLTAKHRGETVVTLSVIDKATSNVLHSIPVTVKVSAKSYTVSYNGNGGSSVPGSQTKYHNEALTLSSLKPTRSGYNFKGWGTSSTDTSPDYYADSSYTGNASLTLYAIWESVCANGNHSNKYSLVCKPTLESTGQLSGVCSKCGKSTVITLPVLNNSSYNYSVKTAATCSQSGVGLYTWKTTAYGTYSFELSLPAKGHSWRNATCTFPKSCSECGAVSGSTLSHTYSNDCDISCNACGNIRLTSHSYVGATCTTPKTCKVCGDTSGTASGHSYTNACDTSCNVCNATRTVTHSYKSATCTSPKTCTVCYVTSGSALGHSYTNSCDAYCNTCSAYRTVTHTYKSATCTTPKTCTVCGITSGSAPGHTYTDVCDASCNVCNATRTPVHAYREATCYSPKTCMLCGATTGSVSGHKYSNSCDELCNYCNAYREVTHSFYQATCTAPKVCSVCRTTSGSALGHSYTNSCDSSCNRCGYLRTTSHSYKTVTTKATLTSNGSIIKMCTACSHLASVGTIYSPVSFTLSQTSYAYDGTVKTPTVTVKDSSGKVLTKDADYTVSYDDGRVDAGTYKVTVTMQGNYSGTKTLTFRINASDISACNVKLSATSLTYNGKVRTPAVTVTNADGIKLTKGTDYTVTYSSGRKNVGTYKVTVKMIGKYTGTKTLSFRINPMDISKCTFRLSATSLTYNGKTRTPGVTVINSNGAKLTKDTHYTVSYSSGRVNAGTYNVTVKMQGNYTGTKTLSFKINPINISTCTVKLSATSLTYNGEIRTPEVSVINSYGTTLKEKNYTVTYSSGRKNVGTYKVTVTMKGNYTGTKTLIFKIDPPKTTVASLKAGTKSITVNLTKKATQTTGYQIQYSTNKDFTNAKTKLITSNSTVKATLTGLTANKTYYVRVRTYKTVNDVKYYSGWSAYKYVKTK